MTFYAIILFSIFADLLWFLNWQSIYGLASTGAETAPTADTFGEQAFHKLVLVNSLVLIFLKVISDLRRPSSRCWPSSSTPRLES
jgi:hypothetical protein